MVVNMCTDYLKKNIQETGGNDYFGEGHELAGR